MPLIPSRHFFALVVVATAGVSASAADFEHAPTYIVDPVLGLQVLLSTTRLDRLPNQVRSKCAQMADNDTWTGRQWVFGSVKQDEVTYYLVSGYFKRQHPEPGELRYHQPDQGGIYIVKGTNCGGDPAREVFDVRDFEQVPQPVLQQLAQDLKSRLVRAFGGEASSAR